ncbi:McrB family protein [Salinicoccus sp. HZC-1]|uniref:McrB family protein n=1 Tax=Salinicoccus sp. HZC-1 TaxID=3385497 RepID=UPI00398A63D8
MDKSLPEPHRGGLVFYYKSWNVSEDGLSLKNEQDYEDVLRNMIMLYNDFIQKSGTESNTKEFKERLLSSKNIILHGPPGTGKSYMALELAKQITEDNEEQVEFVQFHPSYDYTDFVEGLRTKQYGNSQIGFELMPGTFMKFCDKARRNQAGSDNFDEAWDALIDELKIEKQIVVPSIREGKDIEFELTGKDTLKFVKGGGGNTTLTPKRIYNLYKGDEKENSRTHSGYRKAVIKYMKGNHKLQDYAEASGKKYVFIIDEINRGEISKIFGELFFSLDPGYRGEKGAVMTQYHALHSAADYPFPERFYVPENVYIIGTMNDIDRSVESFDFAMRRRFRFIEIKAKDSLSMLKQLDKTRVTIDDIVDRLTRLNENIEDIPGLDKSYHIGPSYFLKLKDVEYDFEVLWEEFIYPLLKEYLRNHMDAEEHLDQLKQVYYFDEQDE